MLVSAFGSHFPSLLKATSLREEEQQLARLLPYFPTTTNLYAAKSARRPHYSRGKLACLEENAIRETYKPQPDSPIN